MFDAVTVIEDPTLSAVVDQLAGESDEVSILKRFDQVPSPYELKRLVNGHAYDLAFVGCSDWDRLGPFLEFFRRESPGTAVLGVGKQAWAGPSSGSAAESVLLGHLAPPFSVPQFRDCVAAAIRRMRSHTQDNLALFVPAKAGSGASTIALNIAGRLAELGKRVLLIDGDLRSGILADRAGTAPSMPLGDLFARSELLTPAYWNGVVARTLGLDLLATDRRRCAHLPEWSDWFHLLEFACGRYDHVLVDLPEVVNEASEEAVRQAFAVFIICTSEPESLVLARQRIEDVLQRGANPDRVRLLLNRWHKTDPEPAEIERSLGRPVACLIRNDYRIVRKALLDQTLIDAESFVGHDLIALARRLGGFPAIEERSRWGLRQLIGR